MPKSKSKKQKHQDFQKVKLKVGKKLPKGDNVTNLSFKTRQIQLAQKIKDDGGKDIITKKKLSIQDLLRQCDHHSSSARVNAISGLKEMWLNSSADLMVPTNLHGYGEILKKLSTLLIDNEAVIRHSVIHLFKLILNKLSSKSPEEGSSNRLEGRLYSHIHAYLCCAMNHVHEDIKLDALLLFDTLLDCFPHLVVQQTGDLLKNLVGLISAPAYLGAKGDSTTQRLSMNPDSKLPAMKFRSQVLIRLKRTFMEALGDQSRKAVDTEYTRSYKEHVVWSLHRDHDGPHTKQNLSLFTDPNINSSRFSVMFLGGCHELDEYITRPSTLESFLRLSVPVLLQCWKEAHASVTQSDSDNLVSADSVEVMSLVVCIIQLMSVLCASQQRGESSMTSGSDLYLVPPEVLVNSFQQDFEKVLFSDFPYSVHVQRMQTKKRKNKTYQVLDNGAGQSSLVALNLAICDIVSIFCASQSFKPRSNYLAKMEAYLLRSLHKFPSLEHSKIFIRILKNVFSNGHVNASFTKVYTAVLQHYLSCPIKIPQKQLFYNLFAFMTRTWQGWKGINKDTQSTSLSQDKAGFSGILEDFVQNLPRLLIDVVTLKGETEWIMGILTLMAHGYVQNCSHTFHNSFRAVLSSILDPQTGVLTCGVECIQKQLFALLSLGTPLNEDHLRLILNLIRRPVDKPVLHRRKSCSVVSYAIYSIISCISKNIPLSKQDEFNNMTPEQHKQLSDYLRFMFSLQIGMTGEELEATSPQLTTQDSSDRWFSVDFTVNGDQWERHVEIASLVAREMANFCIPALPSKGYHQSFAISGNLEQLWKQTFMNRSKMHIMSAYSLIQFLCQTSLASIAEKPGPELYELASYIVASVLTGMNCQSESNSVVSEQMMWQIKSDVVQCMTNDGSLLNLVMELLANRSKDAPNEAEREAARAAQYLMLLDENIKKKMNTGENVAGREH